MTTEKKYHQEVNCITGEMIEREYTEEEYAQYEIDKTAFAISQAQEQAEIAARAEAKASALAKLAALGLTEAEANALVK